MKLDLEKAIVYIFKDPSWITKLLAGSCFIITSYLIIFTPIAVYAISLSTKGFLFTFFLSVILFFLLNALISGYIAETSNKRINYRCSILPDWSELKNIFVSGLKYFIGYFLYSIPIITISLIFLVLLTFYMGNGLITSNSSSPILFSAMVLLGAISFFLLILYSLFYPLMTACFYKDLKILSFIDFKQAFKILENNKINYFVLILVFIALYFIFQLVCSLLILSILGVLLIPIIYLYFYLILAEIIAQFIILAREK